MPASRRMGELGIELPAVAAPVAAYVPAIRVGDQVWTSGQLPFQSGELVARGKLGAEVTLEDGIAAARVAALNAVAAASELSDGIDGIQRILRVTVYVASVPEFAEQPTVANGASELLQEIFGDAGVHVRSAVGVSVLPLDVPVEVELVVQT